MQANNMNLQPYMRVEFAERLKEFEKNCNVLPDLLQGVSTHDEFHELISLSESFFKFKS